VQMGTAALDPEGRRSLRGLPEANTGAHGGRVRGRRGRGHDPGGPIIFFGFLPRAWRGGVW
ncbi:MAG: hypothetical protein KAJ19_27005, partial [Gammaproteobacteria bacterium]|nr:hypothetical protein [Gammaproteobacteria bacterium]